MRIQEEKGFTLIEILVALTIFSFAVLGMGIGTVALTGTNADTHSRANAINAAQARIEEIKSMNNAALLNLAAACPGPAFGGIGCNDTSTISGTPFARSWRILLDNPVANMHRIDVQVNWTDHGNRTLTFSAAVPRLS